MTQKKYDVRLDFSCFGSGSGMEPLDCGSLTIEEIEQYLQELATKKMVAKDSCAHHLTASFETKESLKVFLARNYQCPNAPYKESMGRLNLYMTNMNNSKCPDRDCFNNIRSGKCTDAFVIETIGKKFFADKYKDNQTKQR